MVKHRKNCETALIQGIPSIPGIQDISSIPGWLEIIKFDWIHEIWLKLWNLAEIVTPISYVRFGLVWKALNPEQWVCITVTRVGLELLGQLKTLPRSGRPQMNLEALQIIKSVQSHLIYTKRVQSNKHYLPIDHIKASQCKQWIWTRVGFDRKQVGCKVSKGLQVVTLHLWLNKYQIQQH